MTFQYTPAIGLQGVKIQRTYRRSGRKGIIELYTNDAAAVVEAFSQTDGVYGFVLLQPCTECGKLECEISDGICAACYYAGLVA